MRQLPLLIVFVLLTAGCDRIPEQLARRTTRLSDAEFVEVYVKLARTRSPEEKARILEEAGTSAKEMEEFVKVRLQDLPALSMVFDSVVAKMGNPPDDGLGRLPRR